MKSKKFILILIVLLILLLIAMVILLKCFKVREEKYVADPPIEIPQREIETNLSKVTNVSNYYAVKSCVDKFYTYYAMSFENNSYSENLYNILDTEYLTFKNITKDNILKQLPKINNSVIDIENMYVSEQQNDMYIYIVDGALRETITSQITNFRIMINIDSSNRTFSVLLDDYIKSKYPKLNLNDKLTVNVSSIPIKGTDNLYEFNNISESTYVSDLFSKYKEEILFYTNFAYDNLDEEYSIKRFGSLEEFNKYVKSNVKNNVTMKVSKYNKTVNDGITQYVCLDQNGREYIFKETAVMDYKMILDTYTIDLPEFVEKYNNAQDNQKVLMNIQKQFHNINPADYKYVYSKLDDTFKQNNYAQLSNFEQYVKNNLYVNNTVGYKDYQKNGYIYVYNIQLTDATGVNSKIIKMKVVMALQQGTDFVLSFSINE